MKKRILTLNFQPFKDEELHQVAESVVAGLTGNKNFPGIDDKIKELIIVKATFWESLSEVKTRDILKIAIKNKIKLELIRQLKQLGKQVAEVAGDDITILIGSGFPLTKHNTDNSLQKPEDFTVMAGSSMGSVIMKVRRVPGARAYMYQYAPDPITPDTQWIYQIGTRCKITLRNLPLGQMMWFRMAAIGINNKMEWTQELYRYIS